MNLLSKQNILKILVSLLVLSFILEFFAMYKFDFSGNNKKDVLLSGQGFGNLSVRSVNPKIYVLSKTNSTFSDILNECQQQSLSCQITNNTLRVKLKSTSDIYDFIKKYGKFYVIGVETIVEFSSNPTILLDNGSKIEVSAPSFRYIFSNLPVLPNQVIQVNIQNAQFLNMSRKLYTFQMLVPLQTQKTIELNISQYIKSNKTLLAVYFDFSNRTKLKSLNLSLPVESYKEKSYAVFSQPLTQNELQALSSAINSFPSIIQVSQNSISIDRLETNKSKIIDFVSQYTNKSLLFPKSYVLFSFDKNISLNISNNYSILHSYTIQLPDQFKDINSNNYRLWVQANEFNLTSEKTPGMIRLNVKTVADLITSIDSYEQVN